MGMGYLHVSANLESVSGSDGDVRFGSKADMTLYLCNVRFTSESGHSSATISCLLCANSGHSTMNRASPLDSCGEQIEPDQRDLGDIGAFLKYQGGSTMNRFTMCALTGLTVGLFFSAGSDAFAQKPTLGKSTSLICKISPGGQDMVRGFVLVTFTNITTASIPKGKTLFASKGDTTIKFQATDAIPQNGNATFKTKSGAFMTAGDCLGWYD
jgi:hypothetical protein